jgi:hypothetical protein
MIPNLTSGSPSLESLEAIRRSQPSATSSAPPTHVRWIWQMTGLAIDSHRFAHSRNTFLNGRSTVGSPAKEPSSSRSTPAENTGPSPRSTTQCTELSSAAARSSLPSASSMTWFIALRFSGRFKTMWRTAPRSSVTTMLMAAFLPWA